MFNLHSFCKSTLAPSSFAKTNHIIKAGIRMQYTLHLRVLRIVQKQATAFKLAPEEVKYD